MLCVMSFSDLSQQSLSYICGIILPIVSPPRWSPLQSLGKYELGLKRLVNISTALKIKI